MYKPLQTRPRTYKSVRGRIIRRGARPAARFLFRSGIPKRRGRAVFRPVPPVLSAFSGRMEGTHETHETCKKKTFLECDAGSCSAGRRTAADGRCDVFSQPARVLHSAWADGGGARFHRAAAAPDEPGYPPLSCPGRGRPGSDRAERAVRLSSAGDGVQCRR